MLLAGVARTNINPMPGVELTGWGYYINRVWREVHDDLHATAIVCDDGSRSVVLLTLDLMVIDEDFTKQTREEISSATGIAEESILLTCSHSHNAPAAGGLLGVGECDPNYEAFASRQAALAAILAWKQREPAILQLGESDWPGVTYNRTRPHGPIDDTRTFAFLKRLDGSTLAIVVNFAGHPTLETERRPYAVSRDLPGLVCDQLEHTHPGSRALYVQGACGDVNFCRPLPKPISSLSALPELLEVALEERDLVGSAMEIVSLPTRPWTLGEIEADRSEARRRLQDNDIAGWKETLGRVMTNRPDDMVRRHGGDEHEAVQAMCRFHLEWTDRILNDLDSRPETLKTEVQAIRVGNLYCVANAAELFSSFALDLRSRANLPFLMIACYANGRIGYLPDAHDINAQSYAAIQSPKYCNQFPFTEQSGPTMVEAMLRVINRLKSL